MNEWRDFLCAHDSLPPVLICDTGWLVNGHHRLIVAREMGCELWGLIVESRSGRWIATGNICKVI